LELEGALQGITKKIVVLSLVYKPGSNTDIFGYVRYIVPGSDAATKDIQRGTFTVSTEPNLLQLPIFIGK
jgi:hypothetical protein